jgi:outer membrane protein OmpA-like peptidoglycan-associated protein
MKFTTYILSATLISLLAACAETPVSRVGAQPKAPIFDLNSGTTTDHGSNDGHVDPISADPSEDPYQELGQLLLVVHFDFNSDKIKQQDSEALLAFIQKMSARRVKLGKGKLTIQGHADARGTDAINNALSGRRANAVLTILRNNKAPLANLDVEAIGQGSRFPVSTGTSEDDYSKNRRVEIRVIDQPAK